MYTDEDLNLAVEKEIFTGKSVDQFRDLMGFTKQTSIADEENFKLITGFNDIFIVIACSLLLFSIVGFFGSLDDRLGYTTTIGCIIFSSISWCLAEFFVLKRRMALPAIFLLLTFVGGIFASFTSFFHSSPEISLLDFSSGASMIIVTAGTVFFSCLHWLRFRVPITIAIATIASSLLLLSIIFTNFPSAKDWLFIILFAFGVISFFFAMYWDALDTRRVTYKADVAFWLHLLSAPLIIHPIFFRLDILNGNDNISSMLIVLTLYLLMTLVSIFIDRRAFMVSSLVYVIYAIYGIVKTFGGVGYSFALTGILIGTALLLLSAFWHRARAFIVSKTPIYIQGFIPEIKKYK